MVHNNCKNQFLVNREALFYFGGTMLLDKMIGGTQGAKGS
jgi:hypothetical protein